MLLRVGCRRSVGGGRRFVRTGLHLIVVAGDVYLRGFQGLVAEQALLANHVSSEGAQEVMSDLLRVDALYVGADDGLLFLEDSNVAVHLHIRELLVFEVLQGGRYLVLTLVVEQYIEGARVVVYFKLSAHRLFDSSQDAADENDVVDRVAVIFALAQSQKEGYLPRHRVSAEPQQPCEQSQA